MTHILTGWKDSPNTNQLSRPMRDTLSNLVLLRQHACDLETRLARMVERIGESEELIDMQADSIAILKKSLKVLEDKVDGYHPKKKGKADDKSS